MLRAFLLASVVDMSMSNILLRGERRRSTRMCISLSWPVCEDDVGTIGKTVFLRSMRPPLGELKFISERLGASSIYIIVLSRLFQ